MTSLPTANTRNAQSRPEGLDPVTDGTWRAPDAVPFNWVPPRDVVAGKSASRSLLQPQPLARRLLPADLFELLFSYVTRGVPANCGPDWSTEAITIARQAGPHVSALTDENTALIWEDIKYQEEAEFIQVVHEIDLFRDPVPADIKISRLAVVPQLNRRGRLILNLSAGVDLPAVRTPGARRTTKRFQASVNETTEPAAHQTAVKRLGSTLLDALLYQYECPSNWIITWSKIDLSDGFWRMIVESGKEKNFVYQLPEIPQKPGKWFVVPSSLQMGWSNSPAYFCTATEAGQIIIQRLLALSLDNGVIFPTLMKLSALKIQGSTTNGVFRPNCPCSCASMWMILYRQLQGLSTDGHKRWNNCG
jgi:hypothetical protein